MDSEFWALDKKKGLNNWIKQVRTKFWSFCEYGETEVCRKDPTLF